MSGKLILFLGNKCCGGGILLREWLKAYFSDFLNTTSTVSDLLLR
jgi:hypothetical protein